MIRAHSRGVKSRGLSGAHLGTSCECPRPTSKSSNSNFLGLPSVSGSNIDDSPKTIQNFTDSQKITEKGSKRSNNLPGSTHRVVCDKCLHLSICPGQRARHPRLSPSKCHTMPKRVGWPVATCTGNGKFYENHLESSESSKSSNNSNIC